MAGMHEEMKTMSPDAFAMLGGQEIVYIKPVTRNGARGFAIYAANGQELALLNSHEAALDAIAENDMVPVLLH